ncbi:MAG: hypothetical protein COX02_01120 [Candidatus Vogelbacteria bacterium CG22_combo_CG10-13_8_21_14_all_37_9]|uniref:DNA polymerase III subunit delta n=1 Tax=Candidatus Vogelbacteria bacterium CG22_combo_CG10-13_8_21_14_all_37_9 TaxID=1975046 RepID=A0A2H0BKS1_9BACT|nr:MAG: hypothetical protein BK005_00475 [bacterium CG10_37_50]PIP58276.1 MAG: hypothetical protein COX02_01120 [Candidatus Vogelbacteria bacterium CG22_combo_CG10-13_8_21_14_all_37_9]
MREILNRHYQQNRLHHAYLLVGDSTLILANLQQFLAKVFPDLNNPLTSPDVAWLEFERLDKERAKELRTLATSRAFSPTGRFIVAVFSALVDEAQEVLLKTLEEPPAGTHFFLVVPSADFFRPTLLSRLERLNLEPELDQVEAVIETPELLADKFLALDQALRSDWLFKNLLIDSEPDRAKIFSFLNQVEKYIVTRVDFNRISVNLNLVLKELLAAKKLLTDQRSSVKMILDYLALILPVTRKNK